MRFKYLRKKGLDRLLDMEQVEKVVPDTDGFSFAQLNELFASAALQWHYENKVDMASILKDLKADNLKSRKKDWLSNLHNPRLGFGR